MSPKLWLPARFTHGGIHQPFDESFHEHGVIILNNPLKNKDLLVDICSKGTHYM